MTSVMADMSSAEAVVSHVGWVDVLGGFVEKREMITAEAVEATMMTALWARKLAVLLVVWAAVAGVGCGSFRPRPIEEIPFKGRVEVQESDGLRVSVAVLSREEARQAFGVDLYDLEIQPVWVRIENSTEVPFWFMLHSLDPDYFSAREAAYKSHFLLRPATNERMDDHFERLGIYPAVPPLGETSGFAFSNVKLGTKEVRIRLFAGGRLEEFTYYVAVPGFKADHSTVDWDAYEAKTDFVDLSTEDQLVEVLRALPCCTTRENGSGKGDPLNLVVIVPKGGLAAFVRAGWDETELLTFSSAWKTFKAFFGGEYRYSPMSALYYDGEPQTLGLQKARDTIHERNHLRLWVTPWRYRGDNVVVGTITRDIGVYFTTRAWNLTTHAIDPDVDEARHYLIEDLFTTESVKTFGMIEGVGAATKDEPHRNLMYAPWWTDGQRAVMRFAPLGEEVRIEEIEYFNFFSLGARTSELRGMKLEGREIVEETLGAENDEAEPVEQ
jgi:hypothetical protein